MIRVAIELLAACRSDRRTQLGELAIWNVTPTEHDDAEYVWVLRSDGIAPQRSDTRAGSPDEEAIEKAAALLGRTDRPVRTDRVTHRRDDGWAALLARVLEEFRP